MSSLKKRTLSKKSGKVYWRSLAELGGDPAFQRDLEREFPGAPLGDAHSFSRRRFMQLMGASFALASGSACRWEKENILPFTRRPASHVPGVPTHYATSMELGGYASPLMVTSFDGRPIKVEGNKQHPMSLGGTSAFAQASVLELYDPDRATEILSRVSGQNSSRSWGEFEVHLQGVMVGEKTSGGAGLRVLAEASSSPTLQRLGQSLLAAYPQAKWVEYEPINRDNERVGTVQAFGAPHRVHLGLDKARVIVALDDDFLLDHPAAVRHARDFADQRRNPKEGLNRLYVVESRYSTTGAMADHRLAVRSEQIKAVLLALTAEVAKNPSVAADAAVMRDLAKDGILGEPNAKFISAVARDLLDNMGKSIVTVGAGQPAEVHALAAQLNGLLSNSGNTVYYTPINDSLGVRGSQALAELTAEMAKGAVSTLVVLGGNPAFNAPAGVPFKDALAKVKNSIHLSLYRDETAQACTWNLPRAHYLESWGDTRSYDGTVSLLQPLIKPLYNGKTSAELLALILGRNLHGRELTQETFATLVGQTLDTDKKWHQAVRDGFVPGTAWPRVTPVHKPVSNVTLDEKTLAGKADNGNLEVTFWPDTHVYDGRFANNGWLQELPDFMSKLTWDSVALFAPDTAAALDVEHQTLVKIKTATAEITVPVFVMPGQAAGTIALSLGYGRTAAGQVAGSIENGVDPVGFDTYGLFRGSEGNFTGDVTVTPLKTFYELGITQDHHSLDDLAKAETAKRVGEIVREADLEDFNKNPEFAKEIVEHPPLESLWTEFNYETGHRWGMAIDLNSCIGCNACVVACQAENNIPIVGKQQVINGREMHWIRIDRYFSGDPAAPEVATQPMLCQQCENAPCEQVCPVAATVHSSEGLNDMVYNRCIGTRYCSDNCPYKVRRFNFFNYHKDLTKPRNQVAKMVYNPEVTVRARGVMEKCTYCVQRIQNVKIAAHNAKRSIEDGEIVTACSQACPSGAITFGDLNDLKSGVAKQHADSRNYAVLEQLNTKPRTTYLAKVRNPNPELS